MTTQRNSFSGSSRLNIGPTSGCGSLSLLAPPYDNVTLFFPKVKVPGAEEAERAPASSCGCAISRSGVVHRYGFWAFRCGSRGFAPGHESVARSCCSMSAAFNPASPKAGGRDRSQKSGDRRTDEQPDRLLTASAWVLRCKAQNLAACG